MTSYKIYVNDRSYTSWEVFDTNNFNKITLDINPIESKLLSNDVFTVNKDNTVNLVHSSVRSGPAMPAVLILAGNKTYGRQHKLQEGQSYTKKRSDMAGGKLLYKCIPDDMRLPEFLVPYEMKNIFGLDIRDLESKDGTVFKKADLNYDKIPFSDNFFDSISAFDYLEHIPRILSGKTNETRFPFIEVMNEVWRTLVDGGRFYALTPCYPSLQAFQDPTHVNIITPSTHLYFCGLKFLDI
jgi:hypothetical protein